MVSYYKHKIENSLDCGSDYVVCVWVLWKNLKKNYESIRQRYNHTFWLSNKLKAVSMMTKVKFIVTRISTSPILICIGGHVIVPYQGCISFAFRNIRWIFNDAFCGALNIKSSISSSCIYDTNLVQLLYFACIKFIWSWRRGQR